MKRWFVSRQCYWGEDDPLAVEIASGGVNYANPDMLAVIYPSLGEGSEYEDPREAAKAAVAVAAAWRRDTGRGRDEITVRHGSTGGSTIPFPAGTDSEAVEWGGSTYITLPKCPECGELLGDERWAPVDHPVDDDEVCCTEFCAEMRHRSVHAEV